MSSNMLIRLDRAYRVDEAINTKENRLVIIRFGREGDEECTKIDEWLASEQKALKNDAVICTVPINAVPELVARFNLIGRRPTILLFYDYTLVHRLSGDEINQEKFKETVDLLVKRKKVGAERIVAHQSTTTNSPAHTSPDDHVPPRVNSGGTHAAVCKWFWCNNQ